jgi:hypothetical protein
VVDELAVSLVINSSHAVVSLKTIEWMGAGNTVIHNLFIKIDPLTGVNLIF